MSDIFKLRENTYNLRNFHIFESQNPRTKKFGFDSIAYKTNHLWKMLRRKLEIQPHSYVEEKNQEGPLDLTLM